VQAARAASPAFAFQALTASPDGAGCEASGRPTTGAAAAAITIDATDTTRAMRPVRFIGDPLDQALLRG
jgi:hypothetical protein